MTTWHRKNGDVLDTVTVEIKGLDVTGLTAATSVEAHVQYGAESPVTLLGAVLDPVGDPSASPVVWPTVLIQLGDGTGWLAAAKRGCWRFETEITFGSGAQLTWPDEGFDQICVGDDLA